MIESGPEIWPRPQSTAATGSVVADRTLGQDALAGQHLQHRLEPVVGRELREPRRLPEAPLGGFAGTHTKNSQPWTAVQLAHLGQQLHGPRVWLATTSTRGRLDGRLRAVGFPRHGSSQ